MTRETPARALLERAFLIAEASGVLDPDQASILHARAAGFLLHTANGEPMPHQLISRRRLNLVLPVVAPTHPIIPSLISSVHALRTRACSKPEMVAAGDRWDWQYYSQLLPETSLLDARFAIHTNTACTL